MAKTTEMVEVSPNELEPYERNAKLHPAEQIEKLKDSIKEFGFISPCLIDKDNRIIAGHGRVEAAKALGMETVPCVYIEGLTETQRRAYIIADNRLTELGGWDMSIVEEELDALAQSGFDVQLTGFDWDKAAELDPIEDDFDAESALNREEARTKPGEIWKLGGHRLMCGDSTGDDLGRLMGEDLADLLLTDPPYGVDYTNKSNWLMNSGLDRTTEALKAIRSQQTIENDYKSDAEFLEFLTVAFSNAAGYMKNGAGYYIWHADTKGHIFRAATAQSIGEIRQVLIWVKNQMVFGRQDYQWKHEPCLYGWKDGGSHYFIDDHTYKTIIEDAADLEKMTKDEMLGILKRLYDETIVPTTALHEERPKANVLHPTMKPVKLFGRLINNSSRAGDIVLDIFGGSGSTIIAAEQLKRRCYTMELDPHYCDVIIERWETFTGEKAVRINE